MASLAHRVAAMETRQVIPPATKIRDTESDEGTSEQPALQTQAELAARVRYLEAEHTQLRDTITPALQGVRPKVGMDTDFARIEHFKEMRAQDREQKIDDYDDNLEEVGNEVAALKEELANTRRQMLKMRSFLIGFLRKDLTNEEVYVLVFLI
jgi:predicted RNase H-like nuclease (RuvC/YqgF family)